MKYLIDGIPKQVTSLARQYKFLRKGDEYRVFDPTFDPAANCSDLIDVSAYILSNNEVQQLPSSDDGDKRRFKVTTDFAASLDWCDCYVSFESEPFILGTCLDISEATERIEALLSRMAMAESAGKKIFLGNMFGLDFEDFMRNHSACINHIINKDDLAGMLEYRGSVFECGASEFNVMVTMIVGTNSSCGKFSCAMKCKKFYESHGERVCIIHTEESYPFLDDQDGTVYGFCRNFSDLNSDEDFQYMQGLVCRIISEKHPDRIIFVTQAGVGVNGVVAAYSGTKNGQKMKGIWDVAVERAFGLDSVVISANWNEMLVAEKLIRYYNIQGAAVDALYISPVTFCGGTFELDNGAFKWQTATLGSIEEVAAHANGMALKHPNIRICCDYAEITDEVSAFKSSKEFLPAAASLMAEDAIQSSIAVLAAEQQEYAVNALAAAVAECKEQLIDDDTYQTAAAAISKVLARKNSK